MPLYSYRAMDPTGKIERGYHRSDTSKNLFQDFKKTGKILIQYRLYRNRFGMNQLNLADLSEFFGYLALFEKSGVGLELSLITLLETFEKPAKKQMIVDCLDGLNQGKNLSTTIGQGRYPYGHLMGGLLKAGEEKGQIGPYCAQIQTFLNDRLLFEKKQKKAIIYPAFVLTTAVFLMGILMVYVVPQFHHFMAGNTPLPLATQILFAVADNFPSLFWGMMIVFGMAGTGIAVGCGASKNFSMAIQAVMGRIPLVRLYDDMAISLCFSVVGGLLESGLGLIPALNGGGQVLHKSLLRARYADFVERAQKGMTMSQSLKKWPLFSPTVLRLIQTGEESGHLGAAFLSGAGHLKQKSDQGIDTYLNLLQPILLIGVGGFLAWIAAAFFLPLYDQIALLEGGI